MSDKNADLTTGPVHRRFLGLWLPMIGGIISVKAIGLSDAYFAGQLGEDALTAVSFTFPIVMVLISIAIGLSAGVSSILSRSVGARAQMRDRQEIVSGAFAMAIIFAVMIGLVGAVAAPSILRLVGARGTALADATGYMRIWFGGLVFLLGPVVANGIFRSLGDGRTPALLMTGVAVFNIALNPVFMFGVGTVPGLGIEGAAVATILARASGAVVAIWLLARKGLIKADADLMLAGLKRWRAVLRIGAPAALSTSVNPIALSISTAAVATLGDPAVAAFGAATKIQSIAVTPLLALSAATAPFAGQNSGADNAGRTRRMLKFAATISLLWALMAAAALFFSGGLLGGLFTNDATINARIALYLQIVPISYVGYGVVISLSSALNGVGRSLTALGLTGLRALVLLAPASWIGVSVADFAGVAWGFLAANAIAGVAALGYVFKGDITERNATDNATDKSRAAAGTGEDTDH